MQFQGVALLSKVLLILRCKLVLQGDRPANIVIKISIQLLVKYVWNINDRNELWNSIFEIHFQFIKAVFWNVQYEEICKDNCQNARNPMDHCIYKYFLSRRWRINEPLHAMLKVNQGE